MVTRPFPDAAHLARLRWLVSRSRAARKRGKRMSGRARKGNRWAKTTLVQAAHAAGKTQTYLGAQYRRLKVRRGGKRAAVTAAHSILVIYYQLLTTGEGYQEKGELH